MSMEKLNAMNGVRCSCGKVHSYASKVHSGSGAIGKLPAVLAELRCKKAFLLCDSNTYEAAGKQVCRLLEEQGISFALHCFREETVEPDEKSVGGAAMSMTGDCDAVIAVGSGVLNDIGKILSNLSGKPYIIVATAPSMDGYASATSSMTRNGLKTSLPSRCADFIIGDTDILRAAPMKLMKSGLGDMLAKYVSICEWRIANLLLGEYYCEEIADLIRSAVKRCVDNVSGLLRREEAAVQAVFEGLVIGGVAMNYAGLSRPASGCEHYLSHVIDMRAVEFGTPMDLHGIQCAIGTLICLRLYETLRGITPDREKALAYVARFDVEQWNETLRSFLGEAAESMIALERKEGKYNKEAHALRLETILEKWEDILQIMEEELPASAEIEALLDAIEAPKSLGDIGIEEALLPTIFGATKDIRDKYVLSRLAWDLGVLDEIV